MKINWTVRIKNETFWLSLIPAVLLLVQVCARPAGYGVHLAGKHPQSAAFLFIAPVCVGIAPGDSKGVGVQRGLLVSAFPLAPQQVYIPGAQPPGLVPSLQEHAVGGIAMGRVWLWQPEAGHFLPAVLCPGKGRLPAVYR